MDQQLVNTKALKKKFTLTHVFDNLLDDGADYVDFSEVDEHFQKNWLISLSKVNGNAELAISCDPLDPADEYSIEAEYNLKMIFKQNRTERRNQKIVFESTDFETFHKTRLMSWDLLRERCSMDGKIKIEINFAITKMTGVVAKKKMDFGERMEEFSDAVLVVGEEKFHVLKKLLSIHSTYFKTLFRGSFEESNKSEVTLQDIDPWEFQKFLELVYGGNSPDDDNFKSIFRLVDMFDASIVFKRCEKFLIEESKKSLREKLYLSYKYRMENAKKKCLSDIKTADDLLSAVPEKLEKMDPTLMATLFEKALEFLK